MEDTLLTPEQVANRLQVADQTVYNLLRAGRLHGIRIGRLWRVRPVDLEAYLTANSNEDARRAQFEALLERVRSHVPPHMTEEEIERDAQVAVHQVRTAIRARERSRQEP